MSATVLRPCIVDARPREWAAIDPMFCRGASFGDGTWCGGDGFPAARSHIDPMSTAQDLGVASGARDHYEHPWITGTGILGRGPRTLCWELARAKPATAWLWVKTYAHMCNR